MPSRQLELCGASHSPCCPCSGHRSGNPKIGGGRTLAATRRAMVTAGLRGGLPALRERLAAPQFTAFGRTADHPRASSPAATSRLRWRRSSACWSRIAAITRRSEEHTSELQSRFELVCRLLLAKKNHLTHQEQQLHQRAVAH